MTRYAVLLRGINVGRGKRVGMADLRGLLEEAGFSDVATLLQSGNVALTSEDSATAIARTVERAITRRLELDVAVVVRTREEIREVIERDPLGDVAGDGSRYVVAFMASAPGKELPELLDSVDAGEDRYVVSGRELFVWCPQGQMKSPLMTALGKADGGPVTTVRNWNTVQKLGALLER
ncbi:DUF1697 domain-containing protein [Trujillonella endophytica]|uniref:Uncharacterized conserved protein, DUF1697 family n=1 Tax=Trujillonella endophytica TaxID=673521 RepID=A0A1H8R2K2_9ACTN|nr:DUF1697 domain-containing protein [Trujillella endophytica]SEO60123.1 Uncharacterized conserved protein, DUF1697 family [Trujillella endophytica]